MYFNLCLNGETEFTTYRIEKLSWNLNLQPSNQKYFFPCKVCNTCCPHWVIHYFLVTAILWHHISSQQKRVILEGMKIHLTSKYYSWEKLCLIQLNPNWTSLWGKSDFEARKPHFTYFIYLYFRNCKDSSTHETHNPLSAFCRRSRPAHYCWCTSDVPVSLICAKQHPPQTADSTEDVSACSCGKPVPYLPLHLSADALSQLQSDTPCAASLSLAWPLHVWMCRGSCDRAHSCHFTCITPRKVPSRPCRGRTLRYSRCVDKDQQINCGN